MLLSIKRSSLPARRSWNTRRPQGCVPLSSPLHPPWGGPPPSLKPPTRFHKAHGQRPARSQHANPCNRDLIQNQANSPGACRENWPDSALLFSMSRKSFVVARSTTLTLRQPPTEQD